MQQGRFDEARDRLREAVASKEASDPPDPQSLAISLGALGQAELRAGSVPAAATCFMRELELLDKDADRTLRAKAASDLADLMNAVGDPFRELGALMQAEELARGDGNMLEVSKCLGRKAHVFSSVGFRQCALDAEEAALSIERDLHGNGSRAVVYRLRNITLLHIEMGNFDRAHEVLDSAGATLEDVEGVSRNHLRGVIEGTRALAIATAGDIPGSHPLFASAVRSLEGDDPNSKRELGMVLSNRGWCLLQLGDPQAAVDDLNRAVDLLDAVGATNIVGKAKGNLKLAMDATRSTAAGRDPTAVI
jgi:tetratricopeptide (TPR) repeat protein